MTVYRISTINMVSVYTGVLKFRPKQILNKIIKTGTSGVQTGYNLKISKLGTLQMIILRAGCSFSAIHQLYII